MVVERLLDELRARGIVGVHLGVDPANANAIGFYEHLGFRVLERDGGGLRRAADPEAVVDGLVDDLVAVISAWGTDDRDADVNGDGLDDLVWRILETSL